jgi:hypothetical protein
MKFKFFRGYVGTLNVMDGQTYATASLYNPNTLWTPEESERRRIERMQIDSDLVNQHIRTTEEYRNRGIISHEQYMRNRDIMIEQERITRLEMVNHSRETDNQIRLYQATRVTTVNPKWWMKIKIAFQETWLSDPIGVVVVTTLATIVTFISVMKLFGA